MTIYQENNGTSPPFKFNDRPSSDVVVRLRTPEGRDEWLYCHVTILVEKSKYFADRLSDTWPTCQILDARTCVEVYCQDSDFDYNVTLLRLLYVFSDSVLSECWHGVQNTLGILRVAFNLGCPKIISSCVEYLEAVPWEETEEEEILRTVPAMGPTVNPILARLQPVDQGAILRIFVSALRFATSSPPLSLRDLKSSAQEQLEYMLSEDDDAPLISSSEVKSEARECIKTLLVRFGSLLESLFNKLEEKSTDFDSEKFELLDFYLSDLLWACQISSKLDIMRDPVISWCEASDRILKLIEKGSSNFETLKVKAKAIEVVAKVLEAVGYGNVVLPTERRLQLVKLWLPFARVAKSTLDSNPSNNEEDISRPKVDTEVWQTLESAFVSIILSLPSGHQVGILTEWLDNQHIQYPDLTEAFELWCYRSKVAKKRLERLPNLT